MLGGPRAGLLLGRARTPGPPARPALPPRDDDRRDPLVGLTVTDWLERAGPKRAADAEFGRQVARATARRWSGCSPAAAWPGSSSLRGPSSARSRSSSSRSATACSCSAPTSRSRSTLPASSGTSSTTAVTRPRGPSSTSPPPAGSVAAGAAVRLARASTPIRTRSTTGRRAPSSRGWTGWRRCGCRRRATREVVRSALTLRGLCHEPTGSILAAATTSLPEELGGVRNWDYRYCWLRDAAMSARVLVDLGSLAEAEALLALGRRLRRPHRRAPGAAAPALHRRGPRARPRGGDRDAARLRRLAAGAGRQRGQPADPAGRLRPDRRPRRRRRGGAVVGPRRATGAIVEAMVQAVERRWHEPDHGIWEARLPPRHHVYSKVMCWLTVDRALHVAALRGEPLRAEWVELRDCIARQRARARLERGGGRLLRRLRRRGDRRLVALDRALGPGRRTTIRASSRRC